MIRELTHTRIKAVDALWRELVRLEDYGGTARILADLFTVEELNAALQKGHKNVTGMFEECREKFGFGQGQPTEFFSDSPDLEAARPFVSDRLWSLFFVIRAIYGRLGILAAKSVDQKQYLDWRHDELLNELLGQVLAEDLIARSKKLKHSAFQQVICPNLEVAFLAEARQVLMGNVSGAPIENLPETRVKGF